MRKNRFEGFKSGLNLDKYLRFPREFYDIEISLNF